MNVKEILDRFGRIFLPREESLNVNDTFLIVTEEEVINLVVTDILDDKMVCERKNK